MRVNLHILLFFTLGCLAGLFTLFVILLALALSDTSDDPSNRSPYITLYKEAYCTDYNNFKCPYEGSSFPAGKTLFETLKANFYSIDTQRDFSDQNKVDFSSWQCRVEETQEFIPTSATGQMTQHYDCWPKNPLPKNITITKR